MKTTNKLFALLTLLALMLAVTPLQAAHATGVRYATPGGTGDCSSWANACTLQTALTGATSGDEIWVMAGTHKPTTVADRYASFLLIDGVAVYGGFAGGETARTQRNPATHVTILSGDLNGNDVGFTNNSENVYHVVIGVTGATLDGFTIKAGNAADYGGGMYNGYGSSPTLTNVTFSGNAADTGGGMSNHMTACPKLTNVTFKGNSATNGGGMNNDPDSCPKLTNVTFSGNAADSGGGMYNWYSIPTLTNVTFKGNSAINGGGMYNGNSSNPQIRNTIFWDNTASVGGAQIYNEGSSAPIVSYSVVEGGYASGTNIITTDPMLGTLGNYGGFTHTIPLQPGSSAIDTGNDTICPATDQRGVPRTYGVHCDIGSYELKKGSLTTRSVGANDGWILESTETSNVGGTLNAAATIFNLGDEVGDKQYRGILSFNTATLPDTAVITKVTLKIKKMGLLGSNPFTILGALKADIRKPNFGTSVTLVASDFQAAVSRAAVGTFGATSVSNWYSAVINSLGYSYINKTGTTQFRLYFTKDDNDDNNADYMKFYSGNYTTTTARPTLIVEYYVP